MILLESVSSTLDIYHVELRIEPRRAGLRLYAPIDAPRESIVFGRGAPPIGSMPRDKEPPFAGAIPGSLLHPSLRGLALRQVARGWLDLDDPQMRQEWSDHAAWFFQWRMDNDLVLPVNRFAETGHHKRGARAHLQRENARLPLTAWVRFAADDLTQAVWHVRRPPDGVIVGADVTGECPVIMTPFAPWFPTLKLEAPATVAADGRARCRVRLVEPDGTPITDRAPTVYLEAVNGYLPKTRVAIENGVAEFSVHALGLEAGDAIELRAGFKFVSALDRAALKVV